MFCVLSKALGDRFVDTAGSKVKDNMKDKVGEIHLVTQSHNALGGRVENKVEDKVGDKAEDKAATMS